MIESSDAQAPHWELQLRFLASWACTRLGDNRRAAWSAGIFSPELQAGGFGGENGGFAFANWVTSGPHRLCRPTVTACAGAGSETGWRRAAPTRPDQRLHAARQFAHRICCSSPDPRFSRPTGLDRV